MSSENETGAEPADWWEGAIEEDSTWTLPLDGEDGLWSTGFLPPPPRPAFLDEHVTTDGLTTCDLCTWAWSDNPDSPLHTDTSGRHYDWHRKRCIIYEHNGFVFSV